jgi:glutamyl-tRNA reductase
MIGMLGLDHHWAPADVRGRVSFSGERVRAALMALVAVPDIQEAVLLSTCNRTEVYVAAADWPRARAAVERFLAAAFALGPEHTLPAVPAALERAEPAPQPLASATGEWVARSSAPQPLSSAVRAAQPEPDVRGYLYAAEGIAAARHLFTVATGLRSMLVGESQILGQVKEALAEAETAGSVGEEMRALWTQAIKVGKRARTETQLGQVDRSLATAGVRVAIDALGGLEGRTALVVGAGRTSQLCAQQLRARGIGRLVLANRSAHAAAELALQVSAEVVALEDVREVIGGVDLIMSATAAPHIVLPAATIASGLAGRHRPLVVVDLAVPADVDPAVGLLPQVVLYGLDQVREAIEPERADQMAATTGAADAEDAAPVVSAPEVAEAEAIVDAGAAEWARARQVRQASPQIAALRRHVDHSQQTELAQALAQLRQLGDLTPAQQAVIERFGKRLVDKMFHHLVARIRSLAEYDEVPPDVTMQVLARLFADPDETGLSGTGRERGE